MSVLAYMFCSTWIPRAILEELSNQCKRKKIGDGKETKETEPDVAAETAEQRSERLREWRERDRARRAAQTGSERQATSQRKSTREHETTAAKTPEETETRLQRISTNQHKRLAGEAPEERETRLQQMRDWQLAKNCHLHRT